MKINEKRNRKEYKFDELKSGDVFFCSNDHEDERLYLLKTDDPKYTAVSLESGALYTQDDFCSEERFIIANAEMNILD